MRSEAQGATRPPRAQPGLPYDWTTRSVVPVAVSQLLRGRSCLRLLVEHIRLTHSKLKDHRTTSIEPHRNMVQNYFATHLAPVWQALRDETQTALLLVWQAASRYWSSSRCSPATPSTTAPATTGTPKDSKNTAPPTKRARQRGEKPPPMPTPTELKKPEAKKEKDPPLVIDEERLAEKARQAEKLFGIKAEQYKQAVVEATAEANAGVHVDDRDMDLGGGGSALMSLIPFLLCAGVLVAYVRSASSPAGPPPSFAAFLARAFPREARVFGWVNR